MDKGRVFFVGNYSKDELSGNSAKVLEFINEAKQSYDIGSIRQRIAEKKNIDISEVTDDRVARVIFSNDANEEFRSTHKRKFSDIKTEIGKLAAKYREEENESLDKTTFANLYVKPMLYAFGGEMADDARSEEAEAFVHRIYKQKPELEALGGLVDNIVNTIGVTIGMPKNEHISDSEKRRALDKFFQGIGGADMDEEGKFNKAHGIGRFLESVLSGLDVTGEAIGDDEELQATLINIMTPKYKKMDENGIVMLDGDGNYIMEDNKDFDPRVANLFRNYFISEEQLTTGDRVLGGVGHLMGTLPYFGLAEAPSKYVATKMLNAIGWAAKTGGLKAGGRIAADAVTYIADPKAEIGTLSKLVASTAKDAALFPTVDLITGSGQDLTKSTLSGAAFGAAGGVTRGLSDLATHNKFLLRNVGKLFDNKFSQLTLGSATTGTVFSSGTALANIVTGDSELNTTDVLAEEFAKGATMHFFRTSGVLGKDYAFYKIDRYKAAKEYMELVKNRDKNVETLTENFATTINEIVAKALKDKRVESAEDVLSALDEELQKAGIEVPKDALEDDTAKLDVSGLDTEGGKTFEWDAKPGEAPKAEEITITPATDGIRVVEEVVGGEPKDSGAKGAESKPEETSPEPGSKVKLPGASKYTVKDQAKSDKANKFIGRGSDRSSTGKYAKAWGNKANTGEYSQSDVVFVSAEGARDGREEFDQEELGRAVGAGATIITDDKDNRDRAYNVGEREVAKFLLEKEYEEVEPGVWKPKAQGNRINSDAPGEPEKAPINLPPSDDKGNDKLSLDEARTLAEALSAGELNFIDGTVEANVDAIKSNTGAAYDNELSRVKYVLLPTAALHDELTKDLPELAGRASKLSDAELDHDINSLSDRLIEAGLMTKKEHTSMIDIAKRGLGIGDYRKMLENRWMTLYEIDKNKDRILFKRDMDLMKSFFEEATPEELKDNGNGKFFEELRTISTSAITKKEISGSRASNNVILVFNKVVEMANSTKSFSEFADLYDEYTKSVESDHELVVILKGLNENFFNGSRALPGIYRAIKSFVKYGEDGSPINIELPNLKDWATYRNEALLNKNRVPQGIVGENSSNLKSIFGDRLLVTSLGRKTSFSDLTKDERETFVEGMKKSGYFPLFTRGASTTMYFIKPDSRLYGADKKLLSETIVREMFIKEMKNHLTTKEVNEIVSDLDNNKSSFLTALNTHYAMMDYLGKDYAKYGEIKDIVNAVKRFQIPSARGYRFTAHEWYQYDTESRKGVVAPGSNKAPQPMPSNQEIIKKLIASYRAKGSEQSDASLTESINDFIIPIIDDLRNGKPLKPDAISAMPDSLLEELVSILPIELGTEFKDGSGKPMLLFHGSPSLFGEFDEERLGSNTGAPSAKKAFFAARNIGTAITYGEIDKAAKNALGVLEGDNPEPDMDSEYENAKHKEIMSLPKDNQTRIEYEKEQAKRQSEEDAGKGKSWVAKWRDKDKDERVEFDNSTNIYPLFFISKKPLIVDVKGDRKNIGSINAVLDKAKADGYDSVVFKDIYDGGTSGATDVYTVFSSKQIRNVFDVINEQFASGGSVDTKLPAPSMKYKIIKDSDYASIFGMAGDRPKEDTDGAVYVSKDTFNRILELNGVEPTGAFKAFIHDNNIPGYGAIGIKGAFFMASDEMDAYMNKHGLGFVFLDSTAKFKGGREFSTVDGEDSYDLTPESIVFLSSEHKYDEKKEGNGFVHSIRLPMQYINGVNIDMTRDSKFNSLAAAAYNDFVKIIDAAVASNDIEMRGMTPTKMLDRFFNKTVDMNNESEYDMKLDADTGGSGGMALRTMATLGVNRLVMNFPYMREYVQRSILSSTFENIIGAKVEGHQSWLRALGEYADQVKDDTIMLGEGWRDFVVTLKEGQRMTMGEILEAYNATTDEARKAEYGEALSIVAIRTPMENMSGGRVLRVAGFMGSGSGMQSVVTKRNMNFLGGADVDGDKIAILTGLSKNIKDYTRLHESYTEESNNVDAKISDKANVVKDNVAGKITDDEAAELLNMDAKQYAEHKLSIGQTYRRSSIYDEKTQIGTINKNIDAKNFLGYVAGLKRNLGVLMANGFSLVTADDIKFPKGSAFLGEMKRDGKIFYNSGKFSDNKSFTTREDYGDTVGYFTDVIKKAMKANGSDITFVVANTNGFSEAFAQAVIDAGAKLDFLFDASANNGFSPEIIDNIKRYVGHGKYEHTLKTVDAGNFITLGGDFSKAYNKTADDVWGGQKTSGINIGSAGVIKFVYGLDGNNASLTPEFVDNTMKYWIRASADAGKYGGMPPFEESRRAVFKDLFSIRSNGAADMMIEAYSETPEIQIVTNAFNAVFDRVPGDEFETHVGNYDARVAINNFKKYIDDNKASALSYAIASVPDFDPNMLRVVDMGAMNKFVYKKGHSNTALIHLVSTLKRFNLTTDSSIASLTERAITPELRSAILAASKTKDGVIRKSIVEYLDIGDLKGDPTKTVLDALSDLKTLRGALLILRNEANDMVSKDIFDKVSKMAFGKFASAYEAHYKLEPFTVSQKIAGVSKTNDDPGVLMLNSIFDSTSRIKARWNQMNIDGIGVSPDAVEELRKFIFDRAPIENTARNLYFSILLGNKTIEDNKVTGGFSRVSSILDTFPSEVSNAFKSAIIDITTKVTIPTPGVESASLNFGLPVVDMVGFAAKLLTIGKSNQARAYNMKLSRFLTGGDLPDYLHEGGISRTEYLSQIILKANGGTMIDYDSLSPVERRDVVNAMRYVESAEKYMNSPSGENASLLRKAYRAVWIPERIMQHSEITRNAFDRISASQAYVEGLSSYLGSKLLNADKIIMDYAKRQPGNADNNYKYANSQISKFIEGRIDTLPPTLLEAANVFLTPDENLNNRSISDFLHAELANNRSDYANLAYDKIRAKLSASREFGAKFLNADINDVIMLSDAEYNKATLDALENLFTAISSDVGTIEKYYPHKSDDQSRMDSMIRNAKAEEEFWTNLANKGEITPRELSSFLSFVSESGHAKSRDKNSKLATIDVDGYGVITDANFSKDIAGYVKSVLQASNRLLLQREVADAADKLSSLADRSKVPAEAEGLRYLAEYVDNLGRHALKGSRSEEFSPLEEVADITSNVMFSSLLVLNVKAWSRNSTQVVHAALDAGLRITKEAMQWKNGNASNIPYSFNDIAKEVGFQYSLMSKQLEDNDQSTITEAMQAARIQFRIQEIKNSMEALELDYAMGMDEPTYKKVKEGFEKLIAKEERSMSLLNKLTGMRKLSARGAEAGAKVGYQQTESNVRALASAIGFYKGWEDFSKKHKHLVDDGKLSVEVFNAAAKEYAIKAARGLVKSTQYDYHSFNTPEFLRTPKQKSMFQFYSFRVFNTVMYHDIIRDAKDAWKYTGEREPLARFARTMIYATILESLAAGLGWNGLTQLYRPVVADTAINLYKVLMGDDDAMYGLGAAGFIKGLVGPGAQIPLDIIHTTLYNAAEFDGKDAVNESMQKKYGIMVGYHDPKYIVPGLLPTPYDLYSIGRKLATKKGYTYTGLGPDAIKTVFGISPLYQDSGRKRSY